ncbi:MAG: beta-propeller fold lactonase family protein [Candidatus Acidiferrum sp.]
MKISHDGRYAYVTDTVSGTEAQYRVDPDTARVAFINAFPSPTGPTEVDLSPDGRFLYVLVPDEFPQGAPGINIFRVNPLDGSLTPVPGITNLPSTIDGLIVR